MSGHLFLNCEKELQRMESMLQLLKKYNLVFNKDKTPEVNGRPSKEFYTATMPFTRIDGSTGYLSVDGESFPDLFQKISDKLQTL